MEDTCTQESTSEYSSNETWTASSPEVDPLGESSSFTTRVCTDQRTVGNSDNKESDSLSVSYSKSKHDSFKIEMDNGESDFDSNPVKDEIKEEIEVEDFSYNASENDRYSNEGSPNVIFIKEEADWTSSMPLPMSPELDFSNSPVPVEENSSHAAQVEVAEIGDSTCAVVVSADKNGDGPLRIFINTSTPDNFECHKVRRSIVKKMVVPTLLCKPPPNLVKILESHHSSQLPGMRSLSLEGKKCNSEELQKPSFGYPSSVTRPEFKHKRTESESTESLTVAEFLLSETLDTLPISSQQSWCRNLSESSVVSVISGLKRKAYEPESISDVNMEHCQRNAKKSKVVKNGNLTCLEVSEDVKPDKPPCTVMNRNAMNDKKNRVEENGNLNCAVKVFESVKSDRLRHIGRIVNNTSEPSNVEYHEVKPSFAKGMVSPTHLPEPSHNFMKVPKCRVSSQLVGVHCLPVEREKCNSEELHPSNLGHTISAAMFESNCKRTESYNKEPECTESLKVAAAASETSETVVSKPRRSRSRRKKSEKQKIYELGPLSDPRMERCRINAINAKKHRELKKARVMELEKKIVDVSRERDELASKNEILRVANIRLEEQMDHLNNMLKKLKKAGVTELVRTVVEVGRERDELVSEKENLRVANIRLEEQVKHLNNLLKELKKAP